MKNRLASFFLGFAACLLALSLIAAVTRVTVVKNSSGQIFFTDPIICTNSICVRTNLVIVDKAQPGSWLLVVSNGVVQATTNSTPIGL